MPATIQTTETDAPKVVESGTDIAEQPCANGSTGVESETAELLGAYALLIA
ncbi:hypothetical protein [Streptomyces sp. NBC_01439]|uniref:hypothetical protein n=1 Tax=Streptomyces sp. NBC_01439 TaxID=2903867 RepID=UPI002E3191EC|nr:hypothetical protein [Streptomyces sp. NBC_01439]